MNEMIEKARTIQEKRKNFSGKEKVDYSYLKEWRSARSLLNDKHFNEMLEKNEMTEEEFAYSLQPTTDIENQEGDEWYEVYSEVMEQFKDDYIDVEAGVGIAALPFSIFFKNKIEAVIDNLKNIKVADIVLERFIEAHVTEMFGITGKLVALKLAYYKQRNEFKAKEEREQFNEFLNYSFGKKDNFEKFYEEYPVAARVATVRTLYLIDNYSAILKHLDKDYKEIEKFLEKENLELTDISLSTGDSHAQGNSVSILKFEDKKLVYKPKDLRINQAFEAFIDWYSKSSNLLDIRIPKGIYKETYAYNEFIEKKYCKSDEEVERFYTRYGYLVAICYLLNINDLHLENIIAHGEHPIIIDMETLFQIPAPIGEKSMQYKVAKHLELDSVACSLLLPKQLHMGMKESINLSALNGTGVELSQEVLAPKNVNTPDFHYGNVKGHFAGGDNIPKFNENEEVDVSKYNLVIIDAFETFMNYVKAHRREALVALEAFKGKKVRSLLKSTERYASMIRYADHPNYNRDMKYRERLMLNIWAYPYKDKRIIKSEVDDLIFNDIPIFFTYTDSTDVIDSHGNSYPEYHEVSGYQVAREKIEQLSEETINFQKTIMILSLGIADQYLNIKDRRKKLIKDVKKVNYIYRAAQLADKVMETAYQNDEECIFINLDCDSREHWGLVPSDIGVYSGLSGIAIVYLELYRKTQEKRFLDCYHKLMKTAVKNTKHTTFESAFTGWLSPVYPMILEKIYLNTVCDLDYLKRTVSHLDKVTVENLDKLKHHDYIAGFAGIVRLLKLTQRYLPEANLSDETVEKFYSILIKRSKDTFEKKDAKLGMAHGISGMAYGLVSSGNYNQELIKKMLDYEYHLEVNPAKDYKWCWGYPGMLQARMAINRIDSGCIDKEQLNDLLNRFEKLLDTSMNSDTLCHGNGSIVTTLRMLYDTTKDEKWMKYLELYMSNINMHALYEGYKVPKIGDIESKGVFDGIYGVVWMYLYATGNMNNILLLETEAQF
ncbi:type 2 lanthipeptide synthetase LanM [Pseudobutyrivibrio sp.]